MVIPLVGKTYLISSKKDQINVPRSLDQEHDVFEENNDTSLGGDPKQNIKPDQKHRKEYYRKNIIHDLT
jgi:hypothetical protein